jgi:hypothetical protein
MIPNGTLLTQVDDIGVGVFQSWPVVEHQKQAGECQNQKEEERNSAHAPGVSHANSGFADLHRMKMKEHTAQHDQHAFAIGIRNTYTKDGSVYLRFLNVFPDGVGRHTPECRFNSIDYFCH